MEFLVVEKFVYKQIFSYICASKNKYMDFSNKWKIESRSDEELKPKAHLLQCLVDTVEQNKNHDTNQNIYLQNSLRL